MGRYDTDTETVLRRWVIGEYHDAYADGLDALAAFSTADDTTHPAEVRDA